MPAHSREFPWPNYYGRYSFFERQLRNHRKVECLTSHGDGVYTVTREQGDTLRVFVCECYAFGVAEYLETVERLGDLNAVVISSIWCGYSSEAKRYCREENVGLFKIKDFMAALHLDEYWNYLTDEEKK
jgi:hypothetical protein